VNKRNFGAFSCLKALGNRTLGTRERFRTVPIDRAGQQRVEEEVARVRLQTIADLWDH
jgi:hypothetical protein